MKCKIRKDDQVIIIAGKDKGRIGTVKRMLTEKNRVIVEGMNKVVCFNKKTRTGMSSKEASIHISNVAHVDPVDKKAVKVKIVIEGDIKKLVAKRSGKEVRVI